MTHRSSLPALPGLAGLLVAGLALTACGEDAEAAKVDGPSITVEHAQGETEVPLDPSKVVVYDMGVLDTIDTLGGEVAGVPQDFLPDFLAEYAGEEYLDAGTLFEPDYEAVNAAEPDLIIVAGRSAEAYGELSEIAPTIDLTLDADDYLGSFEEQTETLGEIFEKEEEARQALDALEAKTEEVRAETADAGDGLFLLTTGGEISAYGAGSRFGNIIHDVLGVEPADTDIEADTHGEAVSFEYVAETDPAWLFVLDRDVATGESEGGAAQAVLDNELVAGTRAWQDDQVVYLDPARWYVVGSGLSTVDAMVTEIQEAVR
ncbi:siderophore ABC transporter substrate-binding protein [Nocardioides sp. SYSU DS0663]|uniref:siderophore ABC transporter substrate-binding protein n=1 Tax=Nocardioides sp. SYSU DS0663 TaxID=3416445 RepID=UPI003F4B9A66